MNKPFFFWSNISFSLKSTLNERKGILFVVRKTVSQDFSIQAQFVLHKKENLPSFHSQQVSFSMSQSIKKAAVTFGITVIRKFMWTNQNCHRVGEGRFSWRKKVQENHTIYSTSRSNCLSGPTFSAFGNDIWYCVLKFLGLQDFSRMVLRKWDLNLILDFFDFLNFVQLFSRTHCSQSPPVPTKKNPPEHATSFDSPCLKSAALHLTWPPFGPFYGKRNRQVACGGRKGCSKISEFHHHCCCCWWWWWLLEMHPLARCQKHKNRTPKKRVRGPISPPSLTIWPVFRDNARRVRPPRRVRFW